MADISALTAEISTYGTLKQSKTIYYLGESGNPGVIGSARGEPARAGVRTRNCAIPELPDNSGRIPLKPSQIEGR